MKKHINKEVDKYTLVDEVMELWNSSISENIIKSVDIIRSNYDHLGYFLNLLGLKISLQLDPHRYDPCYCVYSESRNLKECILFFYTTGLSVIKLFPSKGERPSHFDCSYLSINEFCDILLRSVENLKKM